MLITELKNADSLLEAVTRQAFVLICHGCKEVYFPEEEVNGLVRSLQQCGKLAGSLTTDYICNPENLALRLDIHRPSIAAASEILVCSCGVGVQTVADLYPDKKVVACCDTYALPGFQGVTPLEFDCKRCGECYLNLTGGICPITACSKSLVNGQCGGAKNGMCEVDPTMECGWERIQRCLSQLGRLDALKCPVQLRDYTAGNRKGETL